MAAAVRGFGAGLPKPPDCKAACHDAICSLVAGGVFVGLDFFLVETDALSTSSIETNSEMTLPWELPTTWRSPAITLKTASAAATRVASSSSDNRVPTSAAATFGG